MERIEEGEENDEVYQSRVSNNSEQRSEILLPQEGTNDFYLNNIQKSTHGRFAICKSCDSYYDVSLQHECIKALKERIKDLEEKVENMLTKEQVSVVLKGYVSQDFFLNFVRTTEKKFSELFDQQNMHGELLKSSIQGSVYASSFDQLGEITCSKRHKLIQKSNPILLAGITCDLCGTKGKKVGDFVMRCQDCDFDACQDCYQKIIYAKCPKLHGLQIFSKFYDDRNFVCNSCRKMCFEKHSYEYRCEKCDYDICNTCIGLSNRISQSSLK